MSKATKLFSAALRAIVASASKPGKCRVCGATVATGYDCDDCQPKIIY